MKRNSTIRVAKTKALISFAVTAKLICAFVFAHANCWFSHDVAHILIALYLQGCVSSLLDLLLDGMVPELPTSTNTQLPCLGRTASLIQLTHLNTLVCMIFQTLKGS